jgi:hypothetical protein
MGSKGSIMVIETSRFPNYIFDRSSSFFSESVIVKMTTQFPPAMLVGAIATCLRDRKPAAIARDAATNSWAIYDFSEYQNVPPGWRNARNNYYLRHTWEIWDDVLIEAGPCARSDVLQRVARNSTTSKNLS